MESNTKKTEQNELKKINQKSRFFAFPLNPKSLNQQIHVLGAVPHSTPRGFTLVETLVAIAILLVAVVGPISLIGDAVHNIYYVKDEMVAINLAQEAIEAVRQVRDSNNIAGVAWLTGLAVDDYSVDVGKLIIGAPVLTACPGACTPQPVFFDTGTGLYRQGIGDVATPFSREVEISDDIASPFQRKVKAVVSWNTGGETGTITVSESIFNWQP